jgi:AcrR family transcriptional regulator
MKYTEKQMLEAIKGSGGDISEVAKRLGCARSTVYRYLDRYPAVYEALEEEREVLLDIAEYGLMKRVEDGDLRAIIFTLKTKGKDRGYTTWIDLDVTVRREIDDLLDTLRRGLAPTDFDKVMRVLRKREGRAA